MPKNADADAVNFIRYSVFSFGVPLVLVILVVIFDRNFDYELSRDDSDMKSLVARYAVEMYSQMLLVYTPMELAVLGQALGKNLAGSPAAPARHRCFSMGELYV